MVKQMIQTLQDASNSVTCNYCGKKHMVEFIVDEKTSPVVVRYRFSDDTCERFRNAILGSVAKVMVGHGMDYVCIEQ